jgi:hypothetical protein
MSYAMIGADDWTWNVFPQPLPRTSVCPMIAAPTVAGHAA